MVAPDKFALSKTSHDIVNQFAHIPIDHSWAFTGATRKDTGYITHAYHSYPAKFIPQLAGRLIEMYSAVGDLVVDPFMGCGTTLVEAKVRGRTSAGTDINPVAHLISSAKINVLEPLSITEAFHALVRRFAKYDEQDAIAIPIHERLDFWYRPSEKHKLAFLYLAILAIPHEAYYEMLRTNGYLEVKADAYCQDARQSPVADNSVSLVVTSPPYVTSYEYADLHQLPALWFAYTDDLSQFRKQFIGTAYHHRRDMQTYSTIADSIVAQLTHKHKKSADEVAHYFGEMFEVFQEMHRILKVGGKICVVIGNTTLHKVDVLNAEVFMEQLQVLGMSLVTIIKREIPSKNLPSVRDERTGRFAKVTDDNITYAYPTEYILVMETIS